MALEMYIVWVGHQGNIEYDFRGFCTTHEYAMEMIKNIKNEGLCSSCGVKCLPRINVIDTPYENGIATIEIGAFKPVDLVANKYYPLGTLKRAD
jgi:hypothetical protein